MQPDWAVAHLHARDRIHGRSASVRASIGALVCAVTLVFAPGVALGAVSVRPFTITPLNLKGSYHNDQTPTL
jgi:hypothetical protein